MAAPFVSADDILKVDFMTKRSQMKSRWKTENYKGRWFVLTSKVLSYHEGSFEVGHLTLHMHTYKHDKCILNDARSG